MGKQTKVESTEKKQRGQVKKTPEECQEVFDEFVELLGADLRLEVDEKGRCSVSADLGATRTQRVLGPVAGNTFIKQLEAVTALAPHIKSA